MSIASRELILGRLRQSAAAGSAAAQSLAAADQSISAYYADLPRPDRAELIRQFCTAMQAAHAEVMLATPADWVQQLAGKLEQERIGSLLLDTSLAQLQPLLAALPPACRSRAYEQPIEAWKQSLFDDVDAGLCFARSGIASTGTLILVPDSGSPRTMSLVPPLHIGLLYASSLYADMYSAQKAERWEAGMPSNLVMVSGPSKTSDIQQTLAYGAHGPRRMWVVLIDDSNTTEAA